MVEYLFTIRLTARHVSDLKVHPQEQHTIFTYQTSNTQFIDIPEDGPVGPKHVELSNIL